MEKLDLIAKEVAESHGYTYPCGIRKKIIHFATGQKGFLKY